MIKIFWTILVSSAKFRLCYAEFFEKRLTEEYNFLFKFYYLKLNSQKDFFDFQNFVICLETKKEKIENMDKIIIKKNLKQNHTCNKNRFFFW